jgi:hypothetical protein
MPIDVKTLILKAIFSENYSKANIEIEMDSGI